MRRKIFLFILFTVLQNLYGMNSQSSNKELSLCFTSEYNRALNYCWDISAVSTFIFKERYILNSGVAMGTTGNTFDIKCFIYGEAALFANIPVNLSLAYKYNGLPEYDNHSHSIHFTVSFKRQLWGISLGHNFRFTSFFGEPHVFEPILSFLVYVLFINNDNFQLGLTAANYDDFTSGNLSAYFLNLNSVIRLNKKLALINEIVLRQSGSIALTSNFYGIVYRGGVVFSW